MLFWVSFWTVLVGTWDLVSSFFNSSFFVASVTFLTVFGAILTYFYQKKLEKKNIAELLVTEIKNAQDAIDLIKKIGKKELPAIKVLPQNSWIKYSYLFVEDFDEMESKAINDFYSYAEMVNNIILNGNVINLFMVQARQRGDAIQHTLIEMLAYKTQDEIKTFKEKLDTPDLANYHYSPSGFSNYIQPYLDDIKFILDMPVGEKLKKIANKKIRLFKS